MEILPRRCKDKANQIPPKKQINALETFSGDMGGSSVHGQSFKNTTPHLCGGDAFFWPKHWKAIVTDTYLRIYKAFDICVNGFVLQFS